MSETNVENCALQEALQLNHNIVIAMSSNHPTIRETQDDPLASHRALSYKVEATKFVTPS